MMPALAIKPAEKSKPAGKPKRAKGRQVAVHKPGRSTALAISEPRNIYLDAARDPKIDEKKLEALLRMGREQEAHLARVAFDNAFATLNFPVIAKRGKIGVRGGEISYALWPDVNEIIKPILRSQGFAISFRCGATGDKVTVTGILSRAGHREETTITLPVDIGGAKSAVQAVGSTTSFGKRYTAGLLLNLTFSDAGEIDDDGFSAGIRRADVITDEQLAALIKLAKESGADIGRFNAALGIAALAVLPAGRFEEARDRLIAYGNERRKREAAKPDAQVATLPKSAKQYADYARAWFKAETDPAALVARWDGERKLRNDCGVTSEERALIAADMVDRKEALELERADQKAKSQ